MPSPSMEEGLGGGEDWCGVPPTCILPRKEGGKMWVKFSPEGEGEQDRYG
jgi:hypothetical protein